MKILNFLAVILMAIGALNWGSIGLFDYNFVNMILGDHTGMSGIEKVIYTLVGLSGLWGIRMLVCMKKCCGSCPDKCGSSCKNKRPDHHHH